MPSKSNLHEHWMQQALQEAQKALYLSDPNPRVGCVLVSPSGECIGIGHTQKRGQSHAEVMALRHAHKQGHSAQGATAYVTLEPCAHHGRTPPCTDALISAGVSQVIIAATDPNPLVSGEGIALLRKAGIQVEQGLLAQESQELNIGFFSRMQRGLPWVRLKMASSLDGKIALNNGQSQWITGELARANGHAWRARASCILTGVGTILADNPQLNVRSIPVERQPWHAIADTHLRTPPTARIFAHAVAHHTPVFIYTTSTDKSKAQALSEAGATICHVKADQNGHVCLTSILHDLGKRECNELHVEAGGTLAGALLRQGLVDELLAYMAPRLIGQGQDFLRGIELTSLSDTLDFYFHQVSTIGDDLMLLARKKY
ncbi:MAG: bifunctional diaminohydroxyphosphoribosylaminopyrimidine deaminase/5-amino-6-(5-phosphoribosylamino)uracil reductase RibD [Saezia sp.]